MLASSPPHVAVIGAGPAGLIAAETLARHGVRVTVHERMPSVARKFLMAGRGGLNLTHSEPLDAFLGRYGAARDVVAPWIEAFPPAALIDWAEGLGQPVFTGSSGRVFPNAMKASPLLRAWLARLDHLGVEVRTRSDWTGWTNDGALTFATSQGAQTERPDAVILALGGASWPRLGSDAGWTERLAARGVEITPFRPANAGFDIDWSPGFVERFAGSPLKAVGLSFEGRAITGEAMIAAYGIEGGGIYALSAAIREAIARDGSATLTLDLRPALSAAALAARLARPRGKASLSNHLRKAGLDPLTIALLRESAPLPDSPDALAARIKALPLTLKAMRGLERAISSAGGIALSAITPDLRLKALPGVFVAGEMLDWEAPTGGYLLQASFASGVMAANGVMKLLSKGA